MRHSDYAWIGLGVGVAVYEALCRSDELLSVAVDRYRTRHPVLTTMSVIYVAAHLLRWWPPPVDPLHRLAAVKR